MSGYRPPMARVALVFVVLVLVGAVPVALILPLAAGIVLADLLMPWNQDAAR